MTAIRIGIEYARENSKSAIPTGSKRWRQDRRVDLPGRQSCLRAGCVMGGCTVAAWYPITPSSSLCEYFIHYCEKFRVDKQSGEQSSRSCKPKTSSPPPAWSSARAGPARAR